MEARNGVWVANHGNANQTAFVEKAAEDPGAFHTFMARTSDCVGPSAKTLPGLLSGQYQTGCGGKRDVIQTFSPERMHGANGARFRSYINRCLANKFNTLYKKWQQSPLSNATNVPLDGERENGISDEFYHVNSTAFRTRERRNRERDEQRLGVSESVRIGESSIPVLRQFIEIFGTTRSWEEATCQLGRKRDECSRRMVPQLAKSMGGTH
jgi:hypothetical protein